MTMLKVTDIHKDTIKDVPISKFRSETIKFTDLGYNDIIQKYVILENGDVYSIKTELSIRELNKYLKRDINTINKIVTIL